MYLRGSLCLVPEGLTLVNSLGCTCGGEIVRSTIGTLFPESTFLYSLSQRLQRYQYHHQQTLCHMLTPRMYHPADMLPPSRSYALAHHCPCVTFVYLLCSRDICTYARMSFYLPRYHHMHACNHLSRVAAAESYDDAGVRCVLFQVGGRR